MRVPDLDLSADTDFVQTYLHPAWILAAKEHDIKRHTTTEAIPSFVDSFDLVLAGHKVRNACRKAAHNSRGDFSFGLGGLDDWRFRGHRVRFVESGFGFAMVRGIPIPRLWATRAARPRPCCTVSKRSTRA